MGFGNTQIIQLDRQPLPRRSTAYRKDLISARLRHVKVSEGRRRWLPWVGIALRYGRLIAALAPLTYCLLAGHFPFLPNSRTFGHQLVLLAPESISLKHAKHLQQHHGSEEVNAFNEAGNSDAADYSRLLPKAGFQAVPNNNQTPYGLLFDNELDLRLQTLFGGHSTSGGSQALLP